MELLIPMSGIGERFQRRGYNIPKYLLEIKGIPMFVHVVNSFGCLNPSALHFVVNREHIESKDLALEEVIKNWFPAAVIHVISSHKLGPVYALSQVIDKVNSDTAVLVSYCDYACILPRDFDSKALSECDGSVFCYTGFHPHRLRNNKYAYCAQIDEKVVDIREKEWFTDEPMTEMVSAGAYYFSKASLLGSAMKQQLANGEVVNGEYYVSLTYQSLLADRCTVTVSPVDFFMQWGTPEDFEEFLHWLGVFDSLSTTGLDYWLSGSSEENRSEDSVRHNVIVVAAGAGSRFRDKGYSRPKPLIDVLGAPMVLRSLRGLPVGSGGQVVVLASEKFKDEIGNALNRPNEFPKGVTIASVSGLTEGQAESAKLAYDAILSDSKAGELLTVGVSDAVSWFKNRSTVEDAVSGSDFDLLVWTAGPSLLNLMHPQMYGWVEIGLDHEVHSLCLKRAPKQFENWEIVTGVFTFSNGLVFKTLYEQLRIADVRVNNELYMDSLIQIAISKGLKVKAIRADIYLSWGTPDELETFRYWSDCFSRWEHSDWNAEI